MTDNTQTQDTPAIDESPEAQKAHALAALDHLRDMVEAGEAVAIVATVITAQAGIATHILTTQHISGMALVGAQEYARTQVYYQAFRRTEA